MPPDPLDASLRDFEPPSSPPPLSAGFAQHHQENHVFSNLDLDSELGSSDAGNSLLLPCESSAGGYSPPAWRRLENGDRDSGFWRGARDLRSGSLAGGGRTGFVQDGRGRFEDDVFGDGEGSVDDEILARAIRTRLPTGSMSPVRRRSPSPGGLRLDRARTKSPSVEPEQTSCESYITS